MEKEPQVQAVLEKMSVECCSLLPNAHSEGTSLVTIAAGVAMLVVEQRKTNQLLEQLLKKE